MKRLSKSRILSWLQCPRKLWFEVHQPELAQTDSQQQMAFDAGHDVGVVAQRVWGGDAPFEVPWFNGDLARSLAVTWQRLADAPGQPLFEATLEHAGVLVREDVSLPGTNGWAVIEIKASTSVKPVNTQDCAIQAWVHRGTGLPLSSIAVGHVNNRFEYAGDEDYRGLFLVEDQTVAVEGLLDSVPRWVNEAQQAATGDRPDVQPGAQCTKPWTCPFMSQCWPGDVEYPIQGLGGSRARLGKLLEAGIRDLRDAPPEALSDSQRRIWRVTRGGHAEVLPGAGEILRALDYPRYYLDFEAFISAVPRWAGTRPYEPIPFQYSCHVETAPGELHHVEFLDTEDRLPLRPLAERLIIDLGEAGPVLQYTGFEQRILVGLAERLPDLAPALRAIEARLVDLHPIVRDSYYHPDQRGSWSIKSVLPTLYGEDAYQALDGVSEGLAAVRAYRDLIEGRVDAGQALEWRRALLEYCRLDTQAMVDLVRYFVTRD